MLYAFRHPGCATLLLTQTDPAERTPLVQAVIRCDRTANSDGCPQPLCETFPNMVRRGMSNKRERLPSLRSGRHLINVCASALSYIRCASSPILSIQSSPGPESILSSPEPVTIQEEIHPAQPSTHNCHHSVIKSPPPRWIASQCSLKV